MFYLECRINPISLENFYEIFMTYLKREKFFYNTDNEQEFIDRVYPDVKIFIDYGVMEKSDNVYVYS